MIIEINGYYSNSDRHMINIDKVESLSIGHIGYSSNNSNNWTLRILLTNQILEIDYLSYEKEAKTAYKLLCDAIRHREGELRFDGNVNKD